MPSFIAKVKGRVQGVGYRFYAQRKAAAYGLAGYAKNMPDGGVEIIAEGDKEKLIAFSIDLKKGPPLAAVEEIQVLWSDNSQNYKSFDIRY